MVCASLNGKNLSNDLCDGRSYFVHFEISSNTTEQILIMLAGPCQNDLKVACQIYECSLTGK